MKVYEKLRNLVPCVNVYIKNRDTGEELKFYSHDAEKIAESEKGCKFMNLEIVEYKAYGYMPLVDILAAEPGTIPPDYYEKETEKYKEEARKAFNRAMLNMLHKDQVEVVEVVHAEWACVNESENVWMCTGKNGCGNEVLLLEGTPSENGWYYCPSCGAKMDGEREDPDA